MKDSFLGCGINDSAHKMFRVFRMSYLYAFCSVFEPFDEFIVVLFKDNQSRTRGTLLPLIAKSRLVETTDRMRDEILKSQFSAISGYVTDKNNQWFSWQLLRLFFAWAIEWASKRHQSGPSFKEYDISNDFYDMEYVACLNNADGILTSDKKLTIPLTKAAFPDKDVILSIDGILDDYRCWQRCGRSNRRIITNREHRQELRPYSCR